MSMYQDDSSSEDIDIKPIIFPSPTTPPSTRISMISSIVSSPKKWSPKSLQDVNRKSAFLPYKHTPNTVLTNLQRGNTQAETPEYISPVVVFHIRAGQGDLTEQEVKQEPNINVLDKNKLSGLHWASAYGQVNSVKLLINYNAKVNLLGPEEESPLILAASGGHLEVVRLLLNSGAEINHVDHICNTALMYAAKGNHPHTCHELLSKGADFSLVNLNDDTALTIAIENGCTLAQTVIQNFIIAKLEAQICYPDSTNDSDN